MSLGLPAGSEVYVMGASILALYAGITRLIIGFAKWGKAVAALPVAVLDGFVVAAVWLVFCSQVGGLLTTLIDQPLDILLLRAHLYKHSSDVESTNRVRHLYVRSLSHAGTSDIGSSGFVLNGPPARCRPWWARRRRG